MLLAVLGKGYKSYSSTNCYDVKDFWSYSEKENENEVHELLEL